MMRRLGDKRAARVLCFPLLIKAAAGGGIATDVDLARLAGTSRAIRAALGRPTASRYLQASTASLLTPGSPCRTWEAPGRGSVLNV
jgi:hypothetical protein